MKIPSKKLMEKNIRTCFNILEDAPMDFSYDIKLVHKNNYLLCNLVIFYGDNYKIKWESEFNIIDYEQIC